jgi:hypothetical protein
MLYATNQCLLLNICVVCSKFAFAAEIVLCAANQRSLLKRVVCSELAFTAEILVYQQ